MGNFLVTGEQTIPPYLAKTQNQSRTLEQALTFDPNYDIGQLPEKNSSDGFWESISMPVEQAGGYVWDTATGTWQAAKDSVTAAAMAVDAAGNRLINSAGDFIDSGLLRIALIFAVLVIGLIFLARSGALAQIFGIVAASR